MVWWMLCMGLASGQVAHDDVELTVYDDLPTTLHPLYARSEAERRAVELVFERLFFRHPRSGEIESRIVGRWVDAGRGRLLVEMKDGLTWHDGEPLTAHDVCFTVSAFQRAIAPAAVYWRQWIAGCEEWDEHTAVIAFRGDWPDMRERAAFPVLPAHILEPTALAKDDPFATEPVGSGPMSARIVRDRVEFVRRPTRQNPASHVDVIHWLAPPEDPLAALADGAADGWVNVPASAWDAAAAAEGLDLRTWETRAQVVLTVSGRTLDLPARQAVAASLDRQSLCELLPADVCTPTASPYLLSTPGVAVPEVTVPDRVRASELLASSSCGPEVVLGVRRDVDQVVPGLADAVAAQLTAAGLAPELRRVAVRGEPREVDLLLELRHHELASDLDTWLHTTGVGHGRLNALSWSDPTTDKLLQKLQRARKPAKVDRFRSRVVRHVAEDVPLVPLVEVRGRSVWRSGVTGELAERWYYSDVTRWEVTPAPLRAHAPAGEPSAPATP